MKKTQKIISTVLVIMLLFSCIPALPASAEEAPAPARALYFHNTLGWENVYQYAWDESGNPLTGDWPGKNLNLCGKDDYGYDIYSIDIPSGATGIVLNNNDGDQTNDITDFNVSGWYLDAEKTGLSIYGSKVYEVIPLTDPVHWTEPVDEPEPTPEPANFKRYMIGDTNGDDTIDINDVTLIQRYLAQ
ncbi:MAG: starch-binding protein, partial [Ruminococcus sp.]|nr:starch-binding protein [Ruminococcus sp.]